MPQIFRPCEGCLLAIVAKRSSSKELTSILIKPIYKRPGKVESTQSQDDFLKFSYVNNVFWEMKRRNQILQDVLTGQLCHKATASNKYIASSTSINRIPNWGYLKMALFCFALGALLYFFTFVGSIFTFFCFLLGGLWIILWLFTFIWRPIHTAIHIQSAFEHLLLIGWFNKVKLLISLMLVLE